MKGEKKPMFFLFLVWSIFEDRQGHFLLQQSEEVVSPPVIFTLVIPAIELFFVVGELLLFMAHNGQ